MMPRPRRRRAPPRSAGPPTSSRSCRPMTTSRTRTPTSAGSQKFAKKDGASIDRQNDIQILWNIYLEYKSRCRIDDMQREQERLRESGTFSTEIMHVHLHVHNLENQLAAERSEREKQMETLKQSMRDEMWKMIGTQPASTQQFSKERTA